MSKYLMVYLGGDHPSSPEEGHQHFALYMDWLSSLGEAVVSSMNPIQNTTTVHPDGSVSEGGTTSMSGYTILQAADMEAAQAMARSCPFLQINGTLEVSELVNMPV